MDQDAEFQKRLLSTFAVEAQEHLKGITDALLRLEQGGDPQRQQDTVEVVFREAHSLKGAARAVNHGDVESLCQALEGLFAALKRKEVPLSAGLFNLMQRARDVLSLLLQPHGARQEGASARIAIIQELGDAARGGGYRQQGEGGLPDHEALKPESAAQAGPVQEVSPMEERVPEVPPMEETVRVSTAKLASLLLLSEEMVSAKLSAGLHAAQMRELRTSCGEWRKEWARVLPALPPVGVLLSKVASGRGAELSAEEAKGIVKILEFQQWNVGFQKSLEQGAVRYLKAAERDRRNLGGMVDNLMGEVKKLMMFPFSSLLEVFPKMVRDLSRDHAKELDLVIGGEELEIDRRVLEEMKDPLIHLVRNCISHGIEVPEERERKHKPRRGKISLLIVPREGRAEVVVADDGAGIDAGELRSALTRSGMVSVEKAAQMSDAELLPFVFQSGVSTSQTITEISGRGLGLAIVREKVEKLGGSVSFESEPDQGTSFRIVLPLSVATFRGLLVRVADRLFVLPAIHVARVLRSKWEEVATVQNKEIIDLGGRGVSLVRLADVLELPEADSVTEQLQAVVVTVGEQSIAFVVDEVMSEREVLMKRIGPQLSRVRNIAGATLLGSGKVVPVLNLPDLIKSALQVRHPAKPPPSQPVPVARQRRILVVEDSITSRMLLKNILESAGYGVTTAVDGVEALTILKNGNYDLVVSDIDMPRMNGFELTARLRGEKEYAELPVVLVTALASREDRERGIDVGASAYIVKSRFDQSDLLETVQRLC